MTWLRSLSAKVLIAYVVGVMLSIALISGGIAAVLAWKHDALTRADIASTTQDVAKELYFDADGRPVGFKDEDEDDDFEFEWVFASLTEEAAYRVLDENGVTAMSSAAGPDFWPRSGDALRLERGSFTFDKDGVTIEGATEPVVNNGRTWFLQFAASQRFLHLVYRAFALPFTSVGITVFSLVLLVTFGACAYAMLRYALRPLHRISQTAAAISPRSLDARLPMQGVPTEIAPLVDSFNRVLERLEHGYQLQREFLATAAHELKTPLALIRAQIELQPDSAERRALLNDVGHMSRQVQQLLLLAEASETRSYRFAEVDVHEVVSEAAGFLQRMADAAEVRLVVAEPAHPVRWNADRGALFMLFKNLLENAVQHSPPQHAVHVEIGSHEMTVRDWGRGVDETQLPRLFDRFWRAAHRRDTGAGLGLTICQEVALAHGWRLTAERVEPGLRFRITPVASHDQSAMWRGPPCRREGSTRVRAAS